MKYEISIIIPIYKTEKYLEKCINSILSQTFFEFELILVDDGSPDNCPKICDYYAENDSRIKVIHKKNGGANSAIKEGILKAKARYLFFVDSDDWIENNALEILYNKAKEKPYDIVVCNSVYEFETHSMNFCRRIIPAGYYDSDDIVKTICPNLWHFDNWNSAISGSRNSKLFSREIILDNLKYFHDDISMGEDWLLTFSVILSSKLIFIMDNRFLYHYRMNESSITHTFNPNSYQESIKWIKYMREIADEKARFDFENIFSQLEIFIAYQAMLKERNRIGIDNKNIIQARLRSICYSNNLLKLTSWRVDDINWKQRIFVSLIKFKAIKSIFYLNYLLKIIRRKR